MVMRVATILTLFLMPIVQPLIASDCAAAAHSGHAHGYRAEHGDGEAVGHGHGEPAAPHAPTVCPHAACGISLTGPVLAAESLVPNVQSMVSIARTMVSFEVPSQDPPPPRLPS